MKIKLDLFLLVQKVETLLFPTNRNIICSVARLQSQIFKTLFVLGFLLYVHWQDAGIRTQDAATAASCATNELHTSLS